MKKLFLFCTIAIITLESFVFQSKPTMKDTVDFIIPKLTGRDVFCSGEVYLSDYNISYTFDYKTNTLIKTIKGEQFGKLVSSTTFITLKKLNPENIKVSEELTCGNLTHINIDISTTNNIENILCKEKYGAEDERTYKANSVRFQVPFKNQELNTDISNRLVKALKNAIAMAGGKKEAY